MVVEIASRWTFKGIVGDGENWKKYQESYGEEVTKEQRREVEKMLGCGDGSAGFARYVCLDCGEEKCISFSCKSRVCSGCGKVYADEWSERLASRLLKVTHRHMTMTVPSELWGILEGNAEWRKVLFEAADATLQAVMKNRPGMVVTLHPYGKDLKVNYHVHVLVPEGGMDEKGRWKAQSFINYEKLRKVWQYEILTRLGRVMPESLENKRLINELFMRYKKGFYVNGEPKVKDGRGIGRYIGRYLRHPAIADSRIVSYDGQEVTFSYHERDKGHKVNRKKTLPVLAFMHGVIRHIPPRQFKMVRYYGIYAPRKQALVKQLLKRMGSLLGRVVSSVSWRARRQRDFQEDPLRCPRCASTEMVLFSLTLPWGGQLRTIGGWSWLFARGDLIDIPLQQPDQTLTQSESLPFQDSFDFPAAA